MARKMRDWVTEECERQVDRIAEAARKERCSRKYLPTAPHIGDSFLPEQHDDMMRKVAKAIAAQEWHARTAPYSWAQPLPLEMEWCETLMNNTGQRAEAAGILWPLAAVERLEFRAASGLQHVLQRRAGFHLLSAGNADGFGAAENVSSQAARGDYHPAAVAQAAHMTSL